jgi:hypothetical protein
MLSLVVLLLRLLDGVSKLLSLFQASLLYDMLLLFSGRGSFC